MFIVLSLLEFFIDVGLYYFLKLGNLINFNNKIVVIFFFSNNKFLYIVVVFLWGWYLIFFYIYIYGL